MSKKLLTQLLLITAGVFVALIIYFAPDQHSEDSTKLEDTLQEHDHEVDAQGNDDMEVSDPLEDIDPSDRDHILQLEAKLASEISVNDKLSLYDSIITFSIQKNIPPLVAKYTEEKANTLPSENNWLLAGDNYFKAFRLSKGQSKEMLLGAVRNYERSLELNPENLKAQTSLGVAYVEGASILGEMPMKGIGMLLEVVNKDPKNVDALTNLGYFAIQSGQYEKAIERFNAVLEIDPDNAEAFIYLTDTYLSQGEREKGIETLEKYKALVDDPLVIQQVDAYIEELMK
tara:strand:+ start:2712 stop:3572 length:861 start_codon:yes stop_codon:yes gene_type:complete